MSHAHVHWRCDTRGSTDSRWTPVSSARRVVQEGHQPLLLQQNATIRDSAQRSQVTSTTKPNRGSPQVRKRSTSSLTRAGIELDSSGHPRRKASCSTDCAGARRRSSTASPTSSEPAQAR